MDSQRKQSQQENTQKPVLVFTGAGGLTGSRAAAAFSDSYHVVGLDISEPQDTANDFGYVNVDLTSDESTAEAFNTIRAEYGSTLAGVIHLAAYHDFSGEPSPFYEELTVEGTRRVLRELHNFDNVEQFVFSSSLLVMKPEGEGTLSEFSPTQAKWDYPRSKLEAERVIKAEAGEIPYVILRIAGVYDNDCHSLPISHQIDRIYTRQLESYVFPGNTQHGQALVHLDDLVSCFLRVVEFRKWQQHDETFLIAEPDVMELERLSEYITIVVQFFLMRAL